MTDGSTSKKSIEYEAVVARFINEDSCKITNCFIGLCSIENSNAVGIADTVSTCLDAANVVNWREKLICMTVDGASVNVGKFNGVVGLIVILPFTFIATIMCSICV